jgi:hypothetical protein
MTIAALTEKLPIDQAIEALRESPDQNEHVKRMLQDTTTGVRETFFRLMAISAADQAGYTVTTNQLAEHLTTLDLMITSHSDEPYGDSDD